ncbi:hypothetical protein CEXT_201201, partial [Caerostris extrusa]
KSSLISSFITFGSNFAAGVIGTKMSRLQVINGIPFPDVPWFKKKNIEETMDYVPHDGDIIIASYPKTGTTWLQYIVLQITSKGESFPSCNDILDKIAPFMEMTGTAVIDNLKGLRMYNHHYPYNRVKKNPKSKYLYIYRHPEDTIVSSHHFFSDVRQEKIDFDEFFEDFLTGNIEYGSYLDNVLSYYNHKDDENMLLISYEKLHANRKEGILRIAKFLGEEYYESLSSDESLLDKIVKHTSFDYMKKNLSLILPQNQPKRAQKTQKILLISSEKGLLATERTCCRQTKSDAYAKELQKL